jgi:hypothetical protein
MDREFPMRSAPRACSSIPARESLCTTTTLARAHHKSPHASAPWVPRGRRYARNAGRRKTMSLSAGDRITIAARPFDERSGRESLLLLNFISRQGGPSGQASRGVRRATVSNKLHIGLCRCAGRSRGGTSSLLTSRRTTSLGYSDVRCVLAAVAFPSGQHSVFSYGTPSRAT